MPLYSYEKEVQQQYLNNEKKVLDDLKKSYKQALDDVNDRIAKLLARYDADTSTVIYQVNYQKAIKAQIESALSRLNDKQYQTISDYLNKCYEDGYIGNMYSLYRQGIPMILPIDEQKKLNAIMHDTKLKEGLYKALGKSVDKLKTQIASELTRGIASGLSFDEIARNISNAAKISIGRARTIARTEGHRIQIQGTRDSQIEAKNHGADIVKQWDSNLDNLTRSSHVKLDRQIREIDEDFDGDGGKAQGPGLFGNPAEDCNCRCALLTRARWALDNKFTKWDYEDGLKEFDPKDYDEYKKKYLRESIKKYDELLENGEKSSKIIMYRKGSTHRKISESGNVIIDKATYNKIVNPAKKNGANIEFAKGEYLEHIRKSGATAVTIGDSIYFTPEVTISDVLEEVYHFNQNRLGVNNQYSPKQRTVMNEIEAKKYLLSVIKKYNIPDEEVRVTREHLETYTKQMEDMKKRGEWDD